MLIVIFALLDNIESIESSSRHAGTSTPISIVGMDVMIQQNRFKILGTVSPIFLQLQGQETTDILASTVRHEASSCQFPHIGVYQREAGATFDPSLEILFVVLPILGISNGSPGKEEGSSMFQGKELPVVAP